MGMFDSFYDTEGNEWQTKAFACMLDRYEIGDAVCSEDAPPSLLAYQVRVLGGRTTREFVDSFATVRNQQLESVPAVRDNSLPLLDYCGGWSVAPTEP